MTGTDAGTDSGTPTAADPAEGDDPVRTCPRCGAQARQRFHGPCASCREALRAAFAPAPREVEVAPYEPAMHVVPNAVALKDD